MKILLLQLSDIHFWEGQHNPLAHENRIKEIVSAVQGSESGIHTCFVIFTGDAAQGALVEEYSMAESFFSRLIHGLSSAQPSWEIKSLYIPGNHDCVLPSEDPPRQAMRDAIFRELESPYHPSDSLIEFCLQAQDPFWEFEARQMDRERALVGTERLFQKHEFEIGENKVVFHLYNSAWLSMRHEKPGQLVMPLDIIPEAPECDLLISLLHHPLNWFVPDNAKAVRKALEHDSDFIMTGHEHESDGVRKKTLEGAVVTVSEGAVLQEHGSARTGFIIHTVDFSKKEAKTAVFQRLIDPGRYDPDMQTEWQSLERNPLRRTVHLQNTWEFSRLLRDVGANFTHPAKAKVALDDLYLYPDFDVHKPAREDPSSEVISILHAEKVLDFVCNESEILFFGTDRCGKTALGKKLYMDLQGRGYTPILLSGDSLLSTEERDIDRFIFDSVTEQYGDTKLEIFKSIQRNFKVVIIDDFHLASAKTRNHVFGRNTENERLNIKGQNQLIDILRDRFDKIIILSDDSVQYQELISEGDDTSHLILFHQCEFREMGHRQRGQIIERWYTLGREHAHNGRDITYQIRQVEHLVDTLLGRDLIPKRPIFIIILLQQHEANQSSNTINGSYGYYYQALITTALERAMRQLSREVTRELEMGMLQTALSHIAYEMFSLDRKALGSDELRDTIEKYQNAYDVRFDLGDFKRVLDTAQILQRTSDGRYRFAYPYLCPYFVAHYISNHMGNIEKHDEMRSMIDQLIGKLYVEDYSNVLMFFMYFTRDRQTLRSLVSLAQSLYAELRPCDLDNDIRFLKGLSDIPLPILLESGNVIRNQDDYRRRVDEQDYIESSRNGDEGDSDPQLSKAKGFKNDDSEAMIYRPETQEGIIEKRDRERQEEQEVTEVALNRFQIFNMAMKTMQLMGQILRNFPGELESEPKRIVATECQMLGLRALNAQLGHVASNLEVFRHVFIHIAQESHRVSEDTREGQKEQEVQRLTDRADTMLSRYLLLTAYISVKRISESLGSEHLRETYKSIVASDSPPAIKLIDTAIKLDHFREFPSDEVIELNGILWRNRFARDILRMMVRDRFLLHHESFSLRQSIGSQLNIRLQVPRAIAAPTKRNM